MRFCFVLLGAALMMLGAAPIFSKPVYVHSRAHKAVKRKLTKHRTVTHYRGTAR